MEAMLLVLLAGLVLGGAVWLLTRKPGWSETDMFRKFDAIPGFTITERHSHEGSGLAADETRGRVAVVPKGETRIIMLGARDLGSWRYQPKDGLFELSLKSRRHPDPFIITFRKSATADEWLKIFKKIVEEH